MSHQPAMGLVYPLVESPGNIERSEMAYLPLQFQQIRETLTAPTAVFLSHLMTCRKSFDDITTLMPEDAPNALELVFWVGGIICIHIWHSPNQWVFWTFVASRTYPYAQVAVSMDLRKVCMFSTHQRSSSGFLRKWRFCKYTLHLQLPPHSHLPQVHPSTEHHWCWPWSPHLFGVFPTATDAVHGLALLPTSAGQLRETSERSNWSGISDSAVTGLVKPYKLQTEDPKSTKNRTQRYKNYTSSLFLFQK